MTTINGLLAAMPDPAAVDEHWRRICRDLVARTEQEAYERGSQDGAVRAIAAYKAAQHGIYRDALLEARRWHLCCRRCRLRGHREGCVDCEDRTRETFSQAVSGESPAELVARARATWEPYGFSPPGLVWLSGPPVHHHRCNEACYAYQPGWYSPEHVIEILRTLPGDYADNIAELERKAATQARRVA